MDNIIQNKRTDSWEDINQWANSKIALYKVRVEDTKMPLFYYLFRIWYICFEQNLCTVERSKMFTKRLKSNLSLIKKLKKALRPNFKIYLLITVQIRVLIRTFYATLMRSVIRKTNKRSYWYMWQFFHLQIRISKFWNYFQYCIP